MHQLSSTSIIPKIFLMNNSFCEDLQKKLPKIIVFFIDLQLIKTQKPQFQLLVHIGIGLEKSIKLAPAEMKARWSGKSTFEGPSNVPCFINIKKFIPFRINYQFQIAVFIIN